MKMRLSGLTELHILRKQEAVGKAEAQTRASLCQKSQVAADAGKLHSADNGTQRSESRGGLVLVGVNLGAVDFGDLEQVIVRREVDETVWRQRLRHLGDEDSGKNVKVAE
jgi:hypothetical protein